MPVPVSRTNSPAANLHPLYWPAQLPDISNAPGYPLLLAACFKLPVIQRQFSIPANGVRFRPDFVINALNQGLFFLAVILVFLLARWLFNAQVAWWSATLFLLTDVFWQFSISGLCTLWLMVLMLGMVVCLVGLERCLAADERTGGRQWAWSIVLGILLGLCGLSRYALLCLAIPIAVYVLVGPWRRKLWLCAVILAVSAALVLPWLARNYRLSGTAFGTVSYAVQQGTWSVPDSRLQRSLQPNLAAISAATLVDKLRDNLSVILVREMPLLGTGWAGLLFWLTVLFPMASETHRRLRNLCLGGILLLAVVEALGQDHPASVQSAIAPDNLLVLWYPLAMVFGVALFFKLLGEYRHELREYRGLLFLGLLGVTSLPLLACLYGARGSGQEEPRVSPVILQRFARWMKPAELLITDVPWAMAWYGHRPSLWIPMRTETDLAVLQKNRWACGMLLTGRSLDNRFVSQWMHGENLGWGGFLANFMTRREVPSAFPYPKKFIGLWPEYVWFSETERWRAPEYR